MAAFTALGSHCEVVRGDAVIRPGRLARLAATLFFTLACSSGTRYIGSHDAATECTGPTEPPAELELDPFYERYLDARGIPVVSSGSVSDTALERACAITLHVLGERADIHARLIENGLRVVVIDEDEVMTDIPEYEDLYETSPDFDWDNAGRGTGPSPDGQIASVAEENLLCSDDDLFAGESILVFSLGHALRSRGILETDPDFDPRLEAAYDAAMAAGLWTDTHAASTYPQYWAEGVQDWFDANRESLPQPDGIHNAINTRVELEAYDSELAAIIAGYVPDDDWQPPCLVRP